MVLWESKLVAQPYLSTLIHVRWSTCTRTRTSTLLWWNGVTPNAGHGNECTWPGNPGKVICDSILLSLLGVVPKTSSLCNNINWSMKCRRAANLPKESFFNECRAHNPKFYSDIDYDSEGVVKNIFWSHASCQANYAEFKDVITFDSTYRSIFYRMLLGSLSEATTIYRMSFLGLPS
jgi:hypothetical protein